MKVDFYKLRYHHLYESFYKHHILFIEDDLVGYWAHLDDEATVWYMLTDIPLQI
jgi:hypothetical protein